MTALKEKVLVLGIKWTAQNIDVQAIDLRHYLAKRYHKISKANRRKIRLHFISIGLIAAPKPRPKCTCPMCGKQHTQLKQSARRAQSETHEKTGTSL